MKAMRQQQREQAAARQRARDRRNLFIIGGVLLAAAAAIFVVAVALNHQAQQVNASRLTFQPVSTLVGQEVADEGTPSHIDPSTAWTYKFYPTTSGQHYSVAGSAPVPWKTIDLLVEWHRVHYVEEPAFGLHQQAGAARSHLPRGQVRDDALYPGHDQEGRPGGLALRAVSGRL